MDLPVRIEFGEGEQYSGKTFDVSTGGVFVPMSKVKDGLQTQSCKVYLDIGTKELCLKAQVVRTTQANGRYPAGVGLRFDNPNLANRFQISQVVHA